MASNVVSLPVEITECVAENLDLEDICSLRLVCKELNRKTLHLFKHRHFKTVRADFTRESLERLQDISSVSSLRHCIQALHLKPGRESGDGFPWSRASLGNLESPLPGASILQDILVERLVNCRSFRIEGYDDVNDPRDSDSFTVSDMIGNMFAIIAETNILVKSFTLEFSQHGSGRILAEKLQLQLHEQPHFLSRWSHLEELHLEVAIMTVDSAWVHNLIKRAVLLRKLSIGFHDDSFPFLDLLIYDCELQGLQYLKLGRADTTEQQILNLMSSFQDNLQELCLFQVKLKAGNMWKPIIVRLKHFPNLNSVSLYYLREFREQEFSNYSFIEYPTLADNPIVPGSEQRDIPRSDCRLLQPSGLPARLTHKKKYYNKPRVMGVSHAGPEMSSFVDIIASDMRTVQPSTMSDL